MTTWVRPRPNGIQVRNADGSRMVESSVAETVSSTQKTMRAA